MGVDTHPNDVPDDDDKRPDRSPWEWIDLLTTEKMSLRDAKRLYNFKSYSPRIVNRALVGDARTIDMVNKTYHVLCTAANFGLLDGKKN